MEHKGDSPLDSELGRLSPIECGQRKRSYQADPDNLLLSRFPLLRLDAETIRDSMLRASGELDLTGGGPYVPTNRTLTGEVVVAADAPGAHASVDLLAASPHAAR